MISIGEFILLSLIVVSAVLATVYLNRKLKEKGYRVNNLLNVLAVLTVSTALCLVGTSVAWILKGVAFALILLYASVEDFTKREADPAFVLYQQRVVQCSYEYGVRKACARYYRHCYSRHLAENE